MGFLEMALRAVAAEFLGSRRQGKRGRVEDNSGTITPSKVAETNQLRPSRFCARTSPHGVGSITTEMRPSCSIRRAKSRTILKCELAS